MTDTSPVRTRDLLATLRGAVQRQTHLVAVEPELVVSRLRNALWLEPETSAHDLLMARAERTLRRRSWLKLTNRPSTLISPRRAMLRVLDHGEAVSAVAWAPDSRALAVGGEGPIVLWDAVAGRMTERLQVRSVASADPATPPTVGAICWSPNGEWLAWSGRLVPVTLHRPATGVTSLLHGDRLVAESLAWSPDCTRLAFGTEDGEVRIWDLRVGEVGRTLPGGHGKIHDLAWSPDGSLLAAASSANSVLVWEARSGRLVAEGEEDLPILAVDWAPDGRRLLYGGLGLSVVVVDLDTWHATPEGSLTGGAFSLSCAGAAETVAAGLSDGSVWFRGGDSDRVFSAHADSVWAIGFSPDATMLASGASDGSVYVWSTALLTTLTRDAEEDTARGHVIKVNSVALSTDRETVGSAGMDSTVRLWDARSGAARGVLDHAGPVTALAWDHRGALLVSAELDLLMGEQVDATADGMPIVGTRATGVLRLWDMRSAGPAVEFARTSEKVRHLAWSRDDSVVAAAADDGSVWLLDVEAMTLRELLQGTAENDLCAPGLDGGASGVSWSPDGTLLAVTGVEEVSLWSIDGRFPARKLHCAETCRGPIAFSPDGTAIAVGVSELVRVLAGSEWTDVVDLDAAAGDVQLLAWAADSRLIAASYPDHSVRLWDTATDRQLASEFTLAPAGAVGFDPAGTMIIVGDTGTASSRCPLPYRYEICGHLSEETQHSRGQQRPSEGR